MGKKKEAPKRLRRAFTFEGHRYYVSGFTSKELDAAERKKRRELEDAAPKRGKDCTYNDFFENWINARRGKVSSNTILRHKCMHKAISSIQISNNLTFGELKVSKITVEDVQSLQNKLLTVDKIKGKDKGYTTNTVNQMISTVRTVLGDAVRKNRLMNFNPALGVDMLIRSEPKARDTIHDALTEDETQLFLDTAKEMESWYYNLYVFLICSGMRIGEATSICPDDIKDDYISIWRTVTKDETGSAFLGDYAKTETSVRDIDLTPELEKAIEDQKRINTLLFDGNVIMRKTPVFRSINGGIVSNCIVRSDMMRICKRAGLKRITPHALRATYATRSAEQGMDPEVLRDNLGHADVGISMNLYSHVKRARRKEQTLAVKYI